MKKHLLIIWALCCSSFLYAEYTMESIYVQDFCTSEFEDFGTKYGGLMARCPYMHPSEHDVFGKRSLDLMSDLWCGDIAMTRYNYGWFSKDEQMMLAYRKSTVWFAYYRWLYTLNKEIDNLKSNDSEHSIELAQALGLRGYIYANLANLYGDRNDDAECCYLYTEDNYKQRAESLSPRKKVCQQAISDLEEAIAIFEKNENQNYNRPDKLYLNREVTCGILAQAALNAAVGSEQEETYLQKALANAQKVIEGGKYSILPQNELLTNGFNDVNSANWMWGMDHDSTTTGNLKSFFGHVDIFTYSYAWSGDTKAIDANLYATIPAWDARKNWFLTSDLGYSIPASYNLTPVNKFFSALNHSSISGEATDRKWLSDDVFMRVEAMYLIASEAAWRLGDLDLSREYLVALVDKRVDENNKEEFQNVSATWTTADELKQQIIYNWRVEMWGEGYGYETMRRWKHERVRGANHKYSPNSTISEEDIVNKFKMPYPYATGDVIEISGEEVEITLYTSECDKPLAEGENAYVAMAGDIVLLYFDESLAPKFNYWEVEMNGEKTTITTPECSLNVKANAKITAHFDRKEDIQILPADPEKNQKLLRDGQILILRGDKTYTITGQEIK